MNKIKEYRELIFEDIKHIDENIGVLEKFKRYLNILNGENLKEL